VKTRRNGYTAPLHAKLNRDVEKKRRWGIGYRVYKDDRTKTKTKVTRKMLILLYISPSPTLRYVPSVVFSYITVRPDKAICEAHTHAQKLVLMAFDAFHSQHTAIGHAPSMHPTGINQNCTRPSTARRRPHML
jgi:hypothetical protein